MKLIGISLLIQKSVIGVMRLNDAINAITAKDLIAQITMRANILKSAP